MTKFEQEIAKWDAERLSVFLQYRHGLLTQAPGNISTKTTDKRIPLYDPFGNPGYPHRKRMRQFSWSDILGADPASIISPNPFTLSDVRQSDDDIPAFKVWDAAIGIPASSVRKAKVIPMRKIPVVRNINDYWRNTIIPAMQRVGPLGSEGKLLRPRAEWIFDLTKMEDGWMLLEAAHVLAHLRGDVRADNRKFGFADSKTSGHFRTELGKIVAALAYDLPIDTQPQDDNKPAEPDFPCCGLELKSSSWFDTPYLRCPWLNREALRLDETLAVMDVGVFLEPHPYGFATGTLNWENHDKWSCSPTIVVIAGWETVDVITHQPLVSIKPEERKLPVCYGMHPLDLVPPDLFWGYLALCKQSGMLKTPEELNAKCGVPKRYRYVKEWIASPEFDVALRRTPPLSCKDCARPNPKTDGAPRRPRGPVPRQKPKNQYGPEALRWQEWVVWDQAMAAIRGIIQRAIDPFMAKLWGGRLFSNRLYKERTRNHKNKLAYLNSIRRRDRIIRKRKKGYRLTPPERKVYNEYLKTRKGESNANSSR